MHVYKKCSLRSEETLAATGQNCNPLYICNKQCSLVLVLYYILAVESASPQITTVGRQLWPFLTAARTRSSWHSHRAQGILVRLTTPQPRSSGHINCSAALKQSTLHLFPRRMPDERQFLVNVRLYPFRHLFGAKKAHDPLESIKLTKIATYKPLLTSEYTTTSACYSCYSSPSSATQRSPEYSQTTGLRKGSRSGDCYFKRRLVPMSL